jgi:hypothetical protein
MMGFGRRVERALHVSVDRSKDNHFYEQHWSAILEHRSASELQAAIPARRALIWGAS